MRPGLPLSLLLLLGAVTSPTVSAICVPRNPNSPAKPGPIGSIVKIIGAAVPRPSPAPAPKPKPTPQQPKPTPLPPGADIVKTLCSKTDYPDLCQSSIAKQPAPPGKLDAAGVLKLEMNAVRVRAAEAKKAASAFIADPKTAKLALGPLGDCVESYDDMVESLNDAEKAMAAGDKGTMGTMLDAARTDVDTCDEGFEERQGLTPLMAAFDQQLAKLTSNCLAISTAAGLR